MAVNAKKNPRSTEGMATGRLMGNSFISSMFVVNLDLWQGDLVLLANCSNRTLRRIISS